ncbi:EP300-interacting inhibitor of differentiation 2 [Otolemur garnettii]|uniref:EP300-interacting inhibitor of differentiation 2 n=1 Tax=Otolemur garnettii TaxID=30611 RepID=UPI000274292B|nr:EP300-interacting inhibitor of differentiation 2 [Otolemur garnettii]
MSELPADVTVLQTNEASGDGDVPQKEVGSGSPELAAAQPEEGTESSRAEAAAPENPMEAAPKSAMAAAPESSMEVARESAVAASPESPIEAAAESAVAAAGPVPRESPAAAARDPRVAEVARLFGEPVDEEVPEARPRSRHGNAGSLAALPYLRLRHPLSILGINYHQFLRHYLENYPIAPGRIQELEERRRRFVEACRAREAAFDAEYHRNPQRIDFDILTFTIALTASEVINPLIEELGCDKFINRD